MTIAPDRRARRSRRAALVLTGALLAPTSWALAPAQAVDADTTIGELPSVQLPLPQLPGTDPLPPLPGTDPVPGGNPLPPVPLPVPGPETTIVSGPEGWVLGRRAKFEYESNLPGVTYECTLDGMTTLCDGTTAEFTGFRSGTHTFGVAARDTLGNADATPATRSFTLPRNNKELAYSRGWKKRTGSGYFLNSFSATSKRGAKLTTRASSIREIALVVSRGKGYGTVKVFLGKKLLKKVSLASTTVQKRRVVDIATFDSPRRGTVKVVVVSAKKKVVVEGLGIATG